MKIIAGIVRDTGKFVTEEMETFIPKRAECCKQGMVPVDQPVNDYVFDDIDRAFEDSHNSTDVEPELVF